MPLYTELAPDALDELWASGAACVVPWGALEWHGQHLPLGLDGIVSEWFGTRLAETLGAVILPTMWSPMTVLPHRHSLQISTEAFRMVLADLLSGLYRSGARCICLVTGHYAHGHLLEMSAAASRAMEQHAGLRVLAGTPLELLGRPELLDHAARYETSQLLAIRPELVCLDLLPERRTVAETAVLGENPRRASAQEGQELFEAGLTSWVHWVQSATTDELSAHYAAVRRGLEGYVQAYYIGSWEDALVAWWEHQIRSGYHGLGPALSE